MYNPGDRDEEAGLGAADLAENLIEEPLDGVPVARKDVLVRDGDGGGGGDANATATGSARITVQRLGSIPSFGRDIPVVRIISSDEPSSSTSVRIDVAEDDDDAHQLQQRSLPDSAGGAAGCGATGGGASDSSNSSAREEAEPSSAAAAAAESPKAFKRPEIADLKLPSSPFQALDRAASKLQEEQPESDDEDDDYDATTTEALLSPNITGRSKARLQEPAPITHAVKDQIADSLLLKRAATMAAVPEDSPLPPQVSPTPAVAAAAAAAAAASPPPLANPASAPRSGGGGGGGSGGGGGGGFADEEDPLEDQIIPEYKEKIKRDESRLWVVSQWVCFLLLVAMLACSLNIKAIRGITWLGDTIWRWQAVALVTFSGRLIAGWLVQAFVVLVEKRFLLRKRVLYFVYGLRKSVKNCIWLALVIAIWEAVIERNHKALQVITRLLWCLFTICVSCMLKVLAVKVAANGFHRAAYFERIQDCLFNQYLLAVLSAPPTMHITSDPGGEELITSRYNPHSGEHEPFDFLNTSPRIQVPIIAKSANPIEQDKLQQLTSENVSAWTLKSLMKLIRKRNLASYSTALSDDREWQIDSEVRAKAAAKQIFYNIARPGRKYLMLRDFLYFLPENKATKAFGLFETTEHGSITKKAFIKWVVNVYKERRALALTLNDNKTVVAKLHRVLNAVQHSHCYLLRSSNLRQVLAVALIIVSLLILGFETAKLLVFFSSIFIPCVFIFGNAAKTTFEALIFLFILHPYDVGDRVSIDGTMMLVEEMNVLNTVFLGPTNEKIYYPNSILGTKFITNYYRSPDQWDGIEFQIHMNTPLEKLGAFKERMQRYVDSQPQFWYPDFGLMCKDIDDCNKMKMGYFFQHHLNYQEAGERYKRRSNMLLYIKQQLEDLGITYQLPSQEVIVTGIPAFSLPLQQASPRGSPGKRNLHLSYP